MLEQAMLREQFMALLSQEQRAADLYARLASELSDPRLRRQLEQLCRDKQRHARMAERLIEIVD